MFILKLYQAFFCFQMLYEFTVHSKSTVVMFVAFLFVCRFFLFNSVVFYECDKSLFSIVDVAAAAATVVVDRVRGVSSAVSGSLSVTNVGLVLAHFPTIVFYGIKINP